MMERTYLVEAMKCGGCAKTIESLLSQVAGVQAVTTDLASKSVTVTGQVDQASLQAALAQTKYVLTAK
ncbi:heavy metal-associated domain-containing protein [uncultured Abiotrophia sp.]|uniref:heavy-metal-associated domain-containing protein n=1 Tax=uncultured Abiotrophia sp. TaxID=316094 RepID=UPI0026269603|nr:heavy metal-associated domain-containing protein [uncultured Abiotrophia sp.]